MRPLFPPVRGLIRDFQMRVRVIQTGLEGVLLGSAVVLDNAIDFFQLCRIISRHSDGFLVGIENNAHNPFLHNKKCAKHALCAVYTSHYI